MFLWASDREDLGVVLNFLLDGVVVVAGRVVVLCVPPPPLLSASYIG